MLEKPLGVKLSKSCLFSLSRSASSCLSGVVMCCYASECWKFSLGPWKDLVKRKHMEVTSSYYLPTHNQYLYRAERV